MFPKQCANCGIDAMMRCTACMDVPEYQPGESVGAVYCNRDCQKQNWPSHRAYCRNMGRRKKLLRSAKILKAALLTYKEIVYDVDLIKIEHKEGILYLHQNQRSITKQAKRGVFPADLTKNAEHKEAALASNQCTTAMALLGRLTRKLLKGVASTIEVLDLHIGKPQTSTKLVPGPDSGNCPHTVLEVGILFANETWIIDATGCQYGFQEVLIPYEDYFINKAAQISGEPTTYDANETKDLDYFSTLPFLNKTRAQREDQRIERRARLRFAAFVDTQVDDSVLDGSTTEFEDMLSKFVDNLKSHMLNVAD